jgi:hypothetical protein
MRSHFAALLLALLVIVSIVCATEIPPRDKIVRSQGIHTLTDDIHHLRCQLNVSRQQDILNTLRVRARTIAENFEQDLHLLNKMTLETCTQIHRDLTQPEARSYHAQLSDWAPNMFNSPIERFVNDAAIFLNSLAPLENKALEMANLYQYNISECISTLEKSCQGTSEPCVGNESFMSRVRSTLEIKACEDIEAPREVTLAAMAWLEVRSDIEGMRKTFGSTWILVMNAQAEEEEVTTEWVANVVASWMVMLEELLVRNRKRETAAKIPNMRQSFLSPPLFDEPLHLGH